MPLLDVDTDLTFSDDPPFWGWMGVPVDVPAAVVELPHAVKTSPKAVAAEPHNSRRATLERSNIEAA
ncbi:MAG TPA: hypothetical protein VK730_00890 [Solirubrobacteraceae bacterium]|nr:hypothetical protein [Solirubrobacteraceae bacterium]